MVPSNSHPASTTLPPSLTSRRTVAARGRRKPAVIASRKGMHRFKVIPSLVTDSADSSTPGRRRYHPGSSVRAGTGSGMTPRSSSRHRNSTGGASCGRRRRKVRRGIVAPLRAQVELLLDEFELELLELLFDEFELELLELL